MIHCRYLSKKNYAKFLNITYGDSVLTTMKAAKIDGDFLPWHDGANTC